MNYILRPLTGSVVAQYSEELAKKKIPLEYLGIGRELTWHGSPNCRSDVDNLNVDRVVEDDEASDTESTGVKTQIEKKHSGLGPRQLNQMIGNAVTYGFVHKNRHLNRNPLIPVVGISGGYGVLMLVLYEPILDVLIYTHPQMWLNRNDGKLVAERILLLWLRLHHLLFLRHLSGDEAKSNLHERFGRDNKLRQ